MIGISVPGFGNLPLSHLVLDYHGAIAFNGKPIAGVMKRIYPLSKSLKIHLVTADTFGTGGAKQ